MLRVFWALFFFSTQSHAFTVVNEYESRFVNPEVTFDVSSDSCSNIEMTPEDVLSFAQKAVDKYWNKIPHCSLNLTKGNVVDIPMNPINAHEPVPLSSVLNRVGNNRILIGCNEDSFADGDDDRTLAIGLTARNRGLVFINSRETSVFKIISREQRLAVLAHEIGHAIGLGHSADPTALMYYDITGKVQKKLSTDDFDGCAYLYPYDFPGSCSLAPLLNQDSGPGEGGGKTRQIFWVGLLSGFLLIMVLTNGVTRLWRN